MYSIHIVGPIELVQHFAYRGVHICARALLELLLIWFGYIARLSQGEERYVLLVQMISTCLRGA